MALVEPHDHLCYQEGYAHAGNNFECPICKHRVEEINDLVIPDNDIDPQYWCKPKKDAIHDLERREISAEFERDSYLKNHLAYQITLIKILQPKFTSLPVVEQAYYRLGGSKYGKCKIGGIELPLKDFKDFIFILHNPVIALVRKNFYQIVPVYGVPYLSSQDNEPCYPTLVRVELQFDLKLERLHTGKVIAAWWEYKGIPITEKHSTENL